MGRGYSKSVDISYGHDSYEVNGDVEDQEVTVTLWSRGTFTVELRLSDDDAESFGAALLQAARVVRMAGNE